MKSIAIGIPLATGPRSPLRFFNGASVCVGAARNVLRIRVCVCVSL